MENAINSNDLMLYTENKLKSHFQNNESFVAQVYILENYYLSKFNNILMESDKEEFESLFSDSVRSQIFNGYFIIRELLAHDQTNIPDEWFSQLDGYITEEIPTLIKDATGANFDDAINSKVMDKLVMWGITRYEDILPILKQTAFDIVCFGALQAVLDERDIRGIESEKSPEKRLLGDIYDYDFITPQLYLSNPDIGIDFESWPLLWWSSINQPEKKAGEVLVHVYQLEEDNYYQLSLYLSKEITEEERENIAMTLLSRLMENEIPRENISLNLAIVEGFYIFVQE